jgi:hypothetical protein
MNKHNIWISKPTITNTAINYLFPWIPESVDEGSFVQRRMIIFLLIIAMLEIVFIVIPKTYTYITTQKPADTQQSKDPALYKENAKQLLANNKTLEAVRTVTQNYSSAQILNGKQNIKQLTLKEMNKSIVDTKLFDNTIFQNQLNIIYKEKSLKEKNERLWQQKVKQWEIEAQYRREHPEQREDLDFTFLLFL